MLRWVGTVCLRVSGHGLLLGGHGLTTKPNLYYITFFSLAQIRKNRQAQIPKSPNPQKPKSPKFRKTKPEQPEKNSKNPGNPRNLKNANVSKFQEILKIMFVDENPQKPEKKPGNPPPATRVRNQRVNVCSKFYPH